MFDDGFRVLLLERRGRSIGGAGAYVLPRADPGRRAGLERTAGRLRAVARPPRPRAGVDVVSSDPEIEASTGYRALIERDGFRPIDEAPLVAPPDAPTLPPGTDEKALFDGFQTTLRSSSGAPQKAGLTVAGDASTGASFQTLYDLLAAAATRRQFRLGPREAFVDWSLEALAAGHLVYLGRTTRGRGPRRRDVLPARWPAHVLPLGGSGRGPAAVPGRRAPAPMARDPAGPAPRGCTEMDLGGVDVAGHAGSRSKASRYGLHVFKRSFGAEWVEQAGAHERVARRAAMPLAGCRAARRARARRAR